MNQMDSQIMKKIREKEFMGRLLDELRGFVMDSIDEGHSDQFPDHLDFLKECTEVFIGAKEMETDEVTNEPAT